MSVYTGNIVSGLLTFPLIAFAITLPYMVYQYRKFGSIPWLRTLIVYSFVFYMLVAGHDVAGVDAHGTGSPRGRGRNGRAGRACAAHVTIIGDGARAAARAIASTLRLRRL